MMEDDERVREELLERIRARREDEEFRNRLLDLVSSEWDLLEELKRRESSGG